jgi:hypothetical protein
LTGQTTEFGLRVSSADSPGLSTRELKCALHVIVREFREREIGDVTRDAALRQGLSNRLAPLAAPVLTGVHELLGEGTIVQVAESDGLGEDLVDLVA